MNWTQKETSLLKDLKQQEQLCVDKYGEYAQRAHDPELKHLFHTIQNVEQAHLKTICGWLGETVPDQAPARQDSCAACAPGSKQTAAEADKFLCMDALCTEKEVSSAYDTSIFEFRDPAVRAQLHQIQGGEQMHGEMLYQYMARNGMYQAQ